MHKKKKYFAQKVVTLFQYVFVHFPLYWFRVVESFDSDRLQGQGERQVQDENPKIL